MKPSLVEQETIIRIDRISDTAEIYTSDSRYMTKFDKLVKNSPEWEFVRQDTCEGDVCGKSYRCPVGYVSFLSKKRAGKPKTEEEKRIAGERFKAWRDAQRQK